MKIYRIEVNLVAIVNWRDLIEEVENQLMFLLGMKGEFVNYVEPWKFWQWRETPEGNVLWNPYSWFENDTNGESYATSITASGRLGKSEIWLFSRPSDNTKNTYLVASCEPMHRPLVASEVVLSIAIALAIAEKTSSSPNDEDGLCGLYRDTTSQEILDTLRCRQAHQEIDSAVKEIIENIRVNAQNNKFGSVI